MIETGVGNLFSSGAYALVCPVTCEGVMAKGLALAFKKRFPWCEPRYVAASAGDALAPGQVVVVQSPEPKYPRFVLHAAIKRRWADVSRLEDVETSLVALSREIESRRLASVAVPALGCGDGQLAWADVRPRMAHAFANLRTVRVKLFPPEPK